MPGVPPTTEPPAVCTPVTIDNNQDGDTTDPNETSCDTGRLPATGSSTVAIAVIGFVLFNVGIVAVTMGRRRWNQG